MRVNLSSGVVLSFLILLSLAVGAQPLMAAKVPSAVQQAAVKGLPTMLQALPEEILDQFNFSSLEELSQAKLGTPFQVFTIPPEEILNYNAGTPIEEIVLETDHWLFPVTVGGDVRALLTVAQMGGQWQAVSLGSAGLGQEWADTAAKYKSSAGYTHKLVRIYQAAADFVLLGDATGNKLLPLKAGGVALRVEGDAEPRDPAEIIFELQGPVQKNIEESQ